jgi:hypothetical protein
LERGYRRGYSVELRTRLRFTNSSSKRDRHSPGAKIGVNCLIFQQVTIGSRGRPGAPDIAGHVDVGAGGHERVLARHDVDNEAKKLRTLFRQAGIF